MAVHFWFGRVLSVFLLVLFGLAGTARANHFLTHPAATPQGAAAREARTLFERGAEIKVKRDAKVYITPQNIPKNDRLLKVYSADKATEGTSAPSLLSIAIQAYRSQAGAGGLYVVQLAALKSQDGARPAWRRLQKAHPALLSERELAIQEIDLGERGIFYRVQAGYFPDRASALELCTALKARGQDCLVVKR